METRRGPHQPGKARPDLSKVLDLKTIRRPCQALSGWGHRFPVSRQGILAPAQLENLGLLGTAEPKSPANGSSTRSGLLRQGRRSVLKVEANPSGALASTVARASLSQNHPLGHPKTQHEGWCPRGGAVQAWESCCVDMEGLSPRGRATSQLGLPAQVLGPPRGPGG